ncbi:MAG TPA: bifunctional transaldolase/phosoglucose isomerase [Candidatus Dormibacteraeota bacterium]|nr:bifunctional transaldolase/phosoglucose isomerase [Candidatus Dormibacteraeota bacterium]
MSTAKSTGSSATGTQTQNPLQALLSFGQSVWLDYIRRSLIDTGELARMIREDGLRGMTSNPAIFEKAIAGSTDYSKFLAELSAKGDLNPTQIYEHLAVRDVQDAADAFRGVYGESKRRDGYVSLEVSPYLAHKSNETIAEARRLWKAVDRPNIMIKVPGTPEGIPAFRQLISEGINVNVTLLFAQEVYERVAEAYIEGLEEFVKHGGDAGQIASVASFFVSRIDTLVDSQLAAFAKSAKSDADRALAQSLQGKVAIANAKLAYQIYKGIFASSRWQSLAGRGAQTQRVLWASTSTKNPKYRDVLYVEELIGRDTVNTIPPATFDAFRDHGVPRASLEENVDDAKKTMQDLARVGVSMKDATDQLTDEGVKLFAEAFDKLLAAVEKSTKKSGAVQASPAVSRFSYKMPKDLQQAVQVTIDDWKANKNSKVKRLWGRDASLWTNSDEGKWLDWLAITEDQISNLKRFERLVEDVRSAGFTHAALLGMGGSSLCVEVLSLTFGKISGHPEMFALDSTDPAQILALEEKLDLAKTVFIVSSKSGSTLEPNIFEQYFFERVKQTVGPAEVAKHFIAITDPGSHLQKAAEAAGFRHIFYGVPGIGGRYSALSNFGMVPGAIQGIDIGKFLDRAEEMVHACASVVPADQNPGVVLGSILGTLQKNGRDKVTIIASPAIFDLGAWLEQLLAESTGKQGKGLIPVDRERLGSPDVYGRDRVFAYLRLESDPDSRQDAAVDAFENAGQPLVRISVRDIYDVAQEFFRWEIATAVAGSVIGINAFNQPDVEASKIETLKLTDAYEKSGSLPSESPILKDGDIQLFTDPKNAADLARAAANDKSLTGLLRAHLHRLEPGDYFAVLGYLNRDAANESKLQAIRHVIRDKYHVATCLGFGPRFLHSTGQAYKGGPNSGVFLQITCDDAADLPVPGHKYTFGVVKSAQARGDFQVLAERNRRVLRVHLGKDVAAGLARLDAAIRAALA